MNQDRTQPKYSEKIVLPFTGYDFFAYFIPGTVFLIVVFLWEIWINKVSIIKPENENVNGLFSTPLRTTFLSTKEFLSLENAITGFIYLIVVIIFAYALGHIISSISSFFVDRILISKGHDYPYIRLFTYNHFSEKNEDSKNFYKGTFLGFNLIILSFYVDVLITNWLPLYYFKWILLVYIFLISILKIYYSNRLHRENRDFEENSQKTNFIADDFVKDISGKDRSKIMDAEKKSLKWRLKWWWKRKLKKDDYIKVLTNGFKHSLLISILNYFFKYIYAFLYNIIFRFFENIIRSDKTFDKDFSTEFIKLYKEEFPYQKNLSDSNTYWLTLLYVVDNSAQFRNYLNNWLHLYGYARNLATSFYLAFLYAFSSLIYHYQVKCIATNSLIALGIPLGFFLISLLMYSRYYYLYYSYYSKFLYRSFVYLKSNDRVNNILDTYQ